MTENPKNISPGFTGPHDIKLNEWISCAPFEKLLNMKIIEADNARATLTLPFYHDYAQGAGLMHGGVLISLADTAVVMAIKSILPPQTHFATISVNSKFLYPVKKGIVTARAEIKIEDERTIQGTAIVYNDDERQVLEFHSTFKIAKHRQIKNNS